MRAELVGELYRRHAQPWLVQELSECGARVVESARGATLRLQSGERIVDFASGGYGYADPRVLSAVAAQMQRMPLSTRTFLSAELSAFVRTLARLMPGDLEVVYPTNSGTEAVDAAMKLARGYHPRRLRVVALGGSYHGSGSSPSGIGNVGSLRALVEDGPIYAERIEAHDFAAMRKAIDETTCAVVLEPVVTMPALALPPPGYVRAVRRRCDEVGALMIVDEITTGLGRTGRMFEIEREGVLPDIAIVGDALGGGVMPMAACVSRLHVNGRVYGRQHPALHGSTTGGNPAACAAATTALRCIGTDDVPHRARALGALLGQALEALGQRYRPYVTFGGALGLLAGLKLTGDARVLREIALRHGVLLRITRDLDHTWVSLRPPLLITREELEQGLAGLDRALSELLCDSHQPSVSA